RVSGGGEVEGGIGKVSRGMAGPGVFPVDKPQAAAVIDEVFGKSIAVNEALRAEAGRFFKEPFDSPAFGAREPAAAWEREVAFADPDEVRFLEIGRSRLPVDHGKQLRDRGERGLGGCSAQGQRSSLDEPRHEHPIPGMDYFGSDPGPSRDPRAARLLLRRNPVVRQVASRSSEVSLPAGEDAEVLVREAGRNGVDPRRLWPQSQAQYDGARVHSAGAAGSRILIFHDRLCLN